MVNNGRRLWMVVSVGSLVGYVALYVLSLMLMSSAGGRVPIYCVMCVLAFCSIVFGTNLVRLLGGIALIAAFTLLLMDQRAGSELQNRVRAIKNAASSQSTTKP
jgi:hypothetical protein